MTPQKALLADELFRKPRLSLHISKVGVRQYKGLTNFTPAAAGLPVRSLREQNQVVLSNRISMGWRENSDIWKTTGVPYSAKHQYVRQHLPQCSKALEVTQRRPRFVKARPRHGAGTRCSWERGKMDGLQCSPPARDLRRNHRAINRK